MPAFFARLLWVLGLSACAPVEQFLRPDHGVELSGTPFFPQTEHHCGPAALAAVLAADGAAVTPEQLAPLIYLPGREGSLQLEIVAVVRRFGRVPVRLDARPEALLAALDQGKPVLLLQNLGLRSRPRWHYAVLVGFDPAEDRFILRSGTTRREELGSRAFLRSWNLAQHWALVISAPEAIPVGVTADAWIAAAAGFEALGQVATANAAYQAAVLRWPGVSLVWQALANGRYLAGDVPAAESALRKALELEPGSAAARNNLASLLLQRGCPSAAQRELAQLGAVPTALETALATTRREIESAAGADLADCPR